MKQLLLIFFLATIALVGCDGGPAPDAKVEDKRMEQAKTLRATFDRTQGNFEKMTPDEKAKVLEIYKGDEPTARRAWGLLQQGGLSGRGASSSSMPTGPGMQGGPR